MAMRLTGDEASKAMLQGLTALIRTKLRERILESIEADIEAAIDGALQSFEASIHSFRDHGDMRDTIHVLIERKDKK
jgi:hypothetical protein